MFSLPVGFPNQRPWQSHPADLQWNQGRGGIPPTVDSCLPGCVEKSGAAFKDKQQPQVATRYKTRFIIAWYYVNWQIESYPISDFLTCFSGNILLLYTIGKKGGTNLWEYESVKRSLQPNIDTDVQAIKMKTWPSKTWFCKPTKMICEQ